MNERDMKYSREKHQTYRDLVWYWRSAHPSLSEHDRELARWMGVAHRVGSNMCYWLMPVSDIPIVNTTVQHITGEDLRNPDIKNRVEEFNTQLSHRLDDSNFTLDGNDIDHFYPNDLYKVSERGPCTGRYRYGRTA